MMPKAFVIQYSKKLYKGKVKKMKKVLVTILALTLVLAMLSGCSSSEGEGASSEPLNVGIMPYLGSVPADYALTQGYFEEMGIEVVLHNFATGAPMNEAFAAGQIDIAVIGLAGVITMSTGTATCILETNTASGGNAIFVRPDSDIASVQGEVEGREMLYGSAETIEGSTIIGQLGTSSQLGVISYLAHFGLTEDDIDFVNMDSGADLQAFLAGEGDAVALATPYAYEAVAAGLVTAADFEDSTSLVMPDVLLAKNEVVADRRDDLQSFVNAYLKAADELNADYDLLYDYSKNFYAENGREYSDENITLDLEVRELIDATYMGADNYVFGEANWTVAQFFVDAGKIEEENLDNVIASFDTSFIEEATGLDVTVESGN